MIPKITSVIKKSQNPVSIKFPEQCPSCNSKLKRLENEAAIRCLNSRNCSEQKIYSLIHFVSRNAFDISGLGEKQIRIFWKKGYILNFHDIFLLEDKIYNKEINLKEIEGFGEKSISNLLSSIKMSKNISFDKFIFSLGIRHVGQGIALILSRKFEDFDKLISFLLNSQSDEKIDGVGDVILNSIKNYFKDEHNLEQVKQLLKIINVNFEKKKSSNFSNKTIVVTGTFKNFQGKN